MEQRQTRPSNTSQSDDNTVLCGIPHHLVDHYWKYAEPLISAATATTDGCMSTEEVRANLMTRDMQLWAFIDPENKNTFNSVVVTQINTYPDGRKFLTFVVGSGRFEVNRHHEQELLDWGKAQGCHGAELYGRRGWMRVLADYKPVSTLYRRYFDGQQ